MKKTFLTHWQHYTVKSNTAKNTHAKINCYCELSHAWSAFVSLCCNSINNTFLDIMFKIKPLGKKTPFNKTLTVGIVAHVRATLHPKLKPMRQSIFTQLSYYDKADHIQCDC